MTTGCLTQHISLFSASQHLICLTVCCTQRRDENRHTEHTGHTHIVIGSVTCKMQSKSNTSGSLRLYHRNKERQTKRRHFLPQHLNRNITDTPSCTSDVIWSQKQHSSEWTTEPHYSVSTQL